MHLVAIVSGIVTSVSDALLTGFFGFFLVLLAAGVRRLATNSTSKKEAHSSSENVDSALGMSPGPTVTPLPETRHEVSTPVYSNHLPATLARLT